MASHCAFCGTAFWPYLKKCKRCRTVFYCGRDCQKQDWKYHKNSCTVEDLLMIEDSSMTLPSSGKQRMALRVSKIPDKVNVHYYVVNGIFYGLILTKFSLF